MSCSRICKQFFLFVVENWLMRRKLVSVEILAPKVWAPSSWAWIISALCVWAWRVSAPSPWSSRISALSLCFWKILLQIFGLGGFRLRVFGLGRFRLRAFGRRRWNFWCRRDLALMFRSRRCGIGIGAGLARAQRLFFLFRSWAGRRGIGNMLSVPT